MASGCSVPQCESNVYISVSPALIFYALKQGHMTVHTCVRVCVYMRVRVCVVQSRCAVTAHLCNTMFWSRI